MRKQYTNYLMKHIDLDAKDMEYNPMANSDQEWKENILARDTFPNENPFYRKVTKEEAEWTLSRINQGWEMTRVNPKTNHIEARLLTLWERIKYWKL